VEDCGGDENSEHKSAKESTEPVTVMLLKVLSVLILVIEQPIQYLQPCPMLLWQYSQMPARY